MGQRAEAAKTRARRMAAEGSARLEKLRKQMPAVDIAVTSFEREHASGGTLIAGGLAYRLFFWLVSAGAFVASVTSFWFDEHPGSLSNAGNRQGLGAVAIDAAQAATNASTSGRWLIIVSSTVAVLYFSSRCVAALNVAFALAWRVPMRKVVRPAKAALVFCGLMGASLAGGAVAAWLESVTGVGIVLELLVLIAVYAGTFTWLMMAMPHADVGLRGLLPGIALSVLATVGMHLFIVRFLAQRLASSNELYGVFGTSTVILVFLYFAARLIAAGAFLNATIADRRSGRPPEDVLTMEERVDELAEQAPADA